MATVVTSENLAEFVSTGKVPEFKAPEKAASNPDPAQASPEASPQAKTNGQDVGKGGEKGAKGAESPGSGENTGKARDANGKFVPADKAGATPAGDDVDPDDVELPERVRRQIGKKHRQMKEAEEFATQEGRRALAAEARARALEEELAQLRGGKAPAESGSSSPGDGFDKPKPEAKNFKTVGEYTDALVEWRVEKAAHQARAKADELASQRSQQQEASELGKAFADREAKFQETCPDYEAVMEDCDLDMHNAGMQYLVESDNGPQLAYWLAKPENQHHIKRINKLTPTRIAAELSKLEEKLVQGQQQQPSEPKSAQAAAAPAAQSRQVSKAPAPIEPLSQDSSASAQVKDPATMSFAELREFRQQEALKKGRR